MDEARRRGRQAVWRYLRFVLGLVLAGVVLYELNGQRSSLLTALGQLGSLHFEWVVVGAGLELLSYIGLAAIQRQLLGAGEVRIGLGFGTALSFATSAVISSLPGGSAFAAVYLFRQYRKKGADRAISTWVLIATFAFEALALSLLASVGVVIALDEGASFDLIGVIFAALIVAAAVDAIVWQRAWLVRVLDWSLTFARRRIGRPRRSVVEVSEALMAHLAAVQLDGKDFARTLAASSVYWIFDCATFAVSFAAVGVAVPWRALLLAYGAAQLAANLPITPGGLGVVEGSLTVALVAFGGQEPGAVTAVLLYRILSFWGPLVVGWCCWTGIFTTERYAQRRAVTDAIATIDPSEAVETGSTAGQRAMPTSQDSRGPHADGREPIDARARALGPGSRGTAIGESGGDAPSAGTNGTRGEPGSSAVALGGVFGPPGPAAFNGASDGHAEHGPAPRWPGST